MAKNLIPEIAHMLGVELGEEFKIKGYDRLTYKLTDNGLELATGDGQKTKWFDHGVLNSLLNGKMEIVKLPWKPKMYEDYWTFGKLGEKWIVGTLSWRELPYEILLFDKGWVYHTRAESAAALPKVAAEFGVEYEL